MEPLHPVTLASPAVRLVPLTREHIAPLVVAAAESRAHYALAYVPDGAEMMERYVTYALDEAARGAALPFATVDGASGRVVGTTRYFNIERWSWPAPHKPLEPAPLGPDAVEIGYTWLAASAQRTAINSAAKLLMLSHAFETWRVYRVTLKTDARNLRSRAAIERLGCRLDGIWRSHLPASDGSVRDSAVFSMLRDEWPAARARLEARLARGEAER
jgi:RimJ/RimL family protein N-acetyltransferase